VNPGTRFSLFRLVNILLWPIFLLILMLVWLFYRKARPYFAERMGLSTGRAGRSYISADPGDGFVLFHLASLGEAHASKALLTRLSEKRRLLVTTTTVTGRESLAAQMPDLPVSLAPLDLPDLWDPFIRSRGIRGIILFETEIWPMMLITAMARKVPVALVNGRLSTTGFGRMKRFRGVLAPLVAGIDPVCVQSPKDRERFMALGANENHVFITGNLKWDIPEQDAPGLATQLDSWLTDTEESVFGHQAQKRFRLLLSSVHPAETKIVLETLSCQEKWPMPIHIVIALRHLDRMNEIRPVLMRFSHVSYRTGGPTDRKDAQTSSIVLSILDTYGELNGLYPAVDAAFIGGTFDPVGGHNPIYAAKAGIPILIGPHFDHIRDLVDALEGGMALIRLSGAEEMCEKIRQLMEDPVYLSLMGENARSVFLSQSGAMERTIESLVPFWESAGKEPVPS
jgi:3-deoxy-D-manno-octulosonic-acid transferase